ncbi:hypothetical protein ABZU25_20910 [Micromonospora sp. NPDC005215]|uniref:hypothetical protein n=1 Tax=Micromonospora sp. NPDC005215 TaxID=3157024 RepID=UPI00339F6E58
MPHGIVDQVAQRTVQLIGIPHHAHRLDSTLDAQAGMLDGDAFTLGVDQIVEVDLVTAQPRG